MTTKIPLAQYPRILYPFLLCTLKTPLLLPYNVPELTVLISNRYTLTIFGSEGTLQFEIIVCMFVLIV